MFENYFFESDVKRLHLVCHKIKRDGHAKIKRDGHSSFNTVYTTYLILLLCDAFS